MANSQIYICDWCESFVTKTDLHRVQILIKPLGGGTQAVYSYDPATSYITSSTTLNRDICITCADRLVEELKLRKTPESLNQEAFKNFQLPPTTPNI